MAWSPRREYKDLQSEQNLNFSSIEDIETNPQMAYEALYQEFSNFTESPWVPDKKVDS